MKNNLSVVTSVMGYTCYMCDAVRRAVRKNNQDPEEDLLLNSRASSQRESVRKYPKRNARASTDGN